MSKKQRLELTWIGKDVRPKLEPRILLEDPEKSYHAPARVTDKDIFDNMLIHGDNLLALKALEQEYTGKVKCIYIDPPYNTGKAFEFYDDGIEHSLWLSLMRDRLELLKKLLRKDGFLCCHIDDSEGPYLKVLLDEIFGRGNFLSTIFVQVRYSEKTLTQDMAFHKQIEQVHVYRNSQDAKPILNKKHNSYDKFCFYVRELELGKELNLGGKKVIHFLPGQYEIFEGESSEEGLKEIWASGSILDGNSSGRFFRDYLHGRASTDGLGSLYKVFGIGDDKFPYRYFTGPKKATATKGKYFQGVPIGKLEEQNSTTTLPIENFYDLAANFGNCRNEGGVDFRGGKKPEKLLSTIIQHFSERGDLVLDSFLGSGTTAAVAHKMGRRWIGIELGDHCYTHCIPRLKRVINGEDLGGITFTQKEKVSVSLCKECKETLCAECEDKIGKNVKPKQVWFGGGGFRFYELGPSLIKQDKWGNAIINPEFNPEMLAEALCKIAGFTYAPDKDVFWMQGRGNETDFLYATTQFLDAAQLISLNEEVGESRSLVVYCSAFRVPEGGMGQLTHLTVRKIPKSVLTACEWNKDDYSLAVQNLPQAEPRPNSGDDAKAGQDAANGPTTKKRKAKNAGQPSLFDLNSAKEGDA